jgi:hypothetical protein
MSVTQLHASRSRIPWLAVARVTLVCLPATWLGAHRGLVARSLSRRCAAAGGTGASAPSSPPKRTECGHRSGSAKLGPFAAAASCPPSLSHGALSPGLSISSTTRSLPRVFRSMLPRSGDSTASAIIVGPLWPPRPPHSDRSPGAHADLPRVYKIEDRHHPALVPCPITVAVGEESSRVPPPP